MLRGKKKGRMKRTMTSPATRSSAGYYYVIVGARAHTRMVGTTPIYLRNIFVGIFPKTLYNALNFGQARPMKHVLCGGFAGTNVGDYWRWGPL